MPVVGLIMPAGDWRDAQLVLSQTTDSAGKITINAIKYGNLVGAAIDFVIIAFVVYLLTKLILPQAPPPAETKTCSECLETIPKAARKCRACTSAV